MTLSYLRELFFSSFKNVNRETDVAIADRYINIAYQEVYRAHHWEYRKRTADLVLIPNYKTGTCTVTKWDGTAGLEDDAKTVVFTGATLIDNMVGRYLQVKNSSYWHKIVYRTGSTLFLDSPIVDVATASGLTFEIWKRFYYLKSDVDVLTDFDRWQNAKLKFTTDSILLDSISNTAMTGTPNRYIVYGIDPYNDIEYTTGTIQIDSDSNLVNGTGTNWLASGFNTGDILRVAGTDFYVKRVESDIRIILFNSVQQSVSSGTIYALRKNNPLGFQFYNPADDYFILPYSYLGKGYPLIHPDKDRILLPQEFVPAIISRAIYLRMKDVDDNRWISMLQVYDAELQGLKMKHRVVQPDFMQFAPKIMGSMPGRR